MKNKHFFLEVYYFNRRNEVLRSMAGLHEHDENHLAKTSIILDNVSETGLEEVRHGSSYRRFRRTLQTDTTPTCCRWVAVRSGAFKLTTIDFKDTINSNPVPKTSALISPLRDIVYLSKTFKGNKLTWEEVQNEFYSATIEIRRCISCDLNGFVDRTLSIRAGGDD